MWPETAGPQQFAFTAMKNALVSHDPICIFSDHFGATGGQKHTHVRDIN